jgi:sigma-B regulation protein RsbU (phosphoserine phosphatase)
MVAGVVNGLLYVDYYFAQKALSEEDVRIVGQIARLASVKLENTRLRESALQKRLMDEELRTASAIQKGLLPGEPPRVPGYDLSGLNNPCRTVSGDYYDFIRRPDGRLYFVIADVSGKGVTAALLMAGIQAAFRIFTKTDPTPAELVSQLHANLRETLPKSKFVTMFVGRLDPEAGLVEYCNAGHVPPLRLSVAGVEELPEADILIGPIAGAKYHDASCGLEEGDALVLFTDGLTESENDDGVEFGVSKLGETLAPLHGETAAEIASQLENAVLEFTNMQALGDDLTLVVVSRVPATA